jgi:hypothetical protein
MTAVQDLNDNYAHQQRHHYRRHLRGLPSHWIPGDELMWQRDPKDWAWLNEPKKIFLTLDQLMEEVKETGINRAVDYLSQHSLHEGWPSDPYDYYEKRGWVSWYHLFGRVFLTLAQLREATEEAGVSKIREYTKSSKLQEGWPANPDLFYKDEWVSWVDLFGKEHLTLDQLKESVKKAEVDSEVDYREIHCKLHKTWPSNPATLYKEWVGWPDLFGREKFQAGRPKNPNFLKFSKLRQAVQREKILHKKHYNEVREAHPEWPANPNARYKEWVSWYHFLGKNKKGELNSVHRKS